MTVTTALPPDDADMAADEAHAWTTGLSDLAVWIQVHPGARLPEPGGFNIRVRGETRGQKISDLEEIAEQWGMQVAGHRDADGKTDGTLIAERWFGPVRIEAHLCPEDRSMTAWREATGRDAAVSPAGSRAAA